MKGLNNRIGFKLLLATVVAVFSFQVNAQAETKYTESQSVKIERNWVEPTHYPTSDELLNWALNGGDFPYKDLSLLIPGKAIATGQFSLQTNLLYWLGGLMNIGAQWRPGGKLDNRLGFVFNGGYSPFSSDDWEHNWGGWYVSPEIRYYIGQKQRWFAGVELLYGECNIKLGDNGRQGSVKAIGGMGGYKLKLNDSLDLDFVVSLAYTYFDYEHYIRKDGYNMHQNDCTRNAVLPIQGGVNLVWKL